MSDDWRPSRYKPRGGLRALLPGGRELLAILGLVASAAVPFFAVTGWDRDLSFDLMKLGALTVVVVFVMPRRPGRASARSDEQRVTPRNHSETR